MDQVFDKAALLAVACDDPHLLAELVTIFRGEYPKLASRLRGAIAAKDAIAIEKSAHALKSLVGNFCAERAYALAEALESTALSGQLDDVQELCERLDQEAERLRGALENLIGGMDCESR